MQNEFEQKFATMRIEAENVVQRLNIGEIDLMEARMQMEHIECVIEQLDNQFVDVDISEKENLSMSAYNENQTAQLLGIQQLIAGIAQNLAQKYENSGINLKQACLAINRAMQVFVESGDPGVENVNISDLILLVSVAERIDFSPIVLTRKCRINSLKEDFVALSAVEDLINVASEVSRREGVYSVSVAAKPGEQSSVIIEVRDQSGLVVDLESEPNSSRCLEGMLSACLGLCNKLEQSFSSTSIIHSMAVCAYRIAKRLLTDTQIVSAAKGNGLWNSIWPGTAFIVGDINEEYDERGERMWKDEGILFKNDSIKSRLEGREMSFAITCIIRGLLKQGFSAEDVGIREEDDESIVMFVKRKMRDGIVEFKAASSICPNISFSLEEIKIIN
jgi:hypothetical protein